MKKAELERELVKIGASLLRRGSRHDIWIAKNGCRIAIPRHKELKDLTAEAIIRQALK